MSDLKHRDKQLCIDLVQRIAKQSRAVRLQVGALLVNDGVMIPGYNGTPAGWDNRCEDEVEVGEVNTSPSGMPPKYEMKYELRTKPQVIHAEMNVFKKAANNPNVIKGGTLFITHAPCQECAKLFLGMGLKEIIYIESYRSTAGLEFLENDGIKVTKWSE